jgi:hypothetical protein
MKYQLVARQRTEDGAEYEDENKAVTETPEIDYNVFLSWVDIDGVSVRITRTYGRFAKFILRKFFGIKVIDITDKDFTK